ncbi:MAG TPA: CHASE3 domain-containing protein [Methylomirabilota bacterium]|nr:CHASE3 domain-containing protein [Methylomirabilota bacterium]
MKPHHFNFWRWMPIGAAMALMILIVIVSVATISELKKSTYWREHTFQVILDAQTFEDKLADAQRSEHGYAVNGAPNLLIEYKNDTNAEMQEFNNLTELTKDNPAQQQRLKDLALAMKAVFDNDSKVIGVYAKQGSKPALQMDDTVESQDETETAVNDLEKFTDEEKKLLVKRDAAEQKDYHHAAHLLIGASILVAVLLVIANYVASREMERRRKAEAKQRGLIDELQNALAEVKTLSGLIPICAWCKSVRNDKGFWSTVEQYVRTHTDADFSHGMCPNCQEKFKADILKANHNS